MRNGLGVAANGQTPEYIPFLFPPRAVWHGAAMSRQPDREHDRDDRFVARVVAAIKAELDQVHAELHAAHAKLDYDHTLIEELKTMSATLQSDLAAQSAAVQALATEVSDGLAANAAAIQALKDQIAAGSPVTAADLTTLEGNTAAVQAATTALQAALNPAPVTPPTP
jgi:capsule polysaccharide export protein KpsE/RkpR